MKSSFLKHKGKKGNPTFGGCDLNGNGTNGVFMKLTYKLFKVASRLRTMGFNL